MIHFSTRTRAAQKDGPWAEVVARARAFERPIIDLTVSNPTQVGLTRLIDPIGVASASTTVEYAPEPLGLESCRRAIVDYYRRRGRSCAVDRIWIGASTSEIYQQIFTVLADPGEAIALPRPGYPLLQHLATLAGLEVRPYALRWDAGGWHLDGETVQSLSRHRAIRGLVVVSPNNPTGHVPSASELHALQDLCREIDCPLIVDEVFADYPLVGERSCHLPLVSIDCPTFVLSGLSKVAALPHVKLSWGVYHGPQDPGNEALRRLAFIADTQLSVTSAVQEAGPRLLERAEDVQLEIRQRLRQNWACARECSADTAMSVLPATAGWSAILRLPAVRDLDDLGWSRLLLEQQGVLTQPGFLYDLGRDHHMVVSLLTTPNRFRTGLGRIAQQVQATCRL